MLRINIKCDKEVGDCATAFGCDNCPGFNYKQQQLLNLSGYSYVLRGEHHDGMFQPDQCVLGIAKCECH
jgi:hypothetical protein